MDQFSSEGNWRENEGTPAPKLVFTGQNCMAPAFYTVVSNLILHGHPIAALVLKAAGMELKKKLT